MAVAFSTNGQWLAAGGDDGTIQLWEAGNNKPANMVEFKHESGVKALAFKPNDNLLASGGKDGRILLWTLGASGKPLQEPKPLLAHDSYVNAIAFSADGKKLATGSNDKSAKIWGLDKNSSEPLLVFNHDAAKVLSVAFSPDGGFLASGSDDNLIRLWFTQTEVLADRVCQNVKRNLTLEEWGKHVGPGIEYEKTCDNLPAAPGSSSGASRSIPK
jgi:WD40 repeat protein